MQNNPGGQMTSFTIKLDENTHFNLKMYVEGKRRGLKGDDRKKMTMSAKAEQYIKEGLARDKAAEREKENGK